jgi:hypothetical protein
MMSGSRKPPALAEAAVLTAWLGSAVTCSAAMPV